MLNAAVQQTEIDDKAAQILDDLVEGQFEYFNRTRALFEIDCPQTSSRINKLCLNEVFSAEKDVSCTSLYKLVVDGKDMGKFKSSGIMISTGTGSSGWLFSARQITPYDVQIVQTLMGVENRNNSEMV